MKDAASFRIDTLLESSIAEFESSRAPVPACVHDAEYLDYLNVLKEINNPNYLEEGVIDRFKNIGAELKKIFKNFREEIVKVAQDTGIGIDSVVAGFRNRNMYAILKGFGFSIKSMLGALSKVSELWRNGLFAVFHEIANTGMMKKIQSGAAKADEILKKYPILKKLSGVLIAALLVYIWMNMTFIGDLDYDFNFEAVFNALMGNFSIEQLFTGASGIMLLTLFATGSIASVPWLGSLPYNLLLALVYTATKYAKNKTIAAKLDALRGKIKFKKIPIKTSTYKA